MKVLQKLVCLFLIGINTIGWDAQAETVSMDHFADRCRIYIKCVRGHATREEYAAAKGTIAFDGVTAALIGTVLTVGTVVLVKCGPKSWQEWKNLGTWHSGSKRKNRQDKPYQIFRPKNKILPEVQKVLDMITPQKDDQVGRSLKIGDQEFVMNSTEEQVILTITQEDIMLNINNYPSIQQFGWHLVQHDNYKGRTMTIIISNKDKSKSYTLKRNSFVVDSQKSTKTTEEDEESLREEQTQNESSGDRNSFQINDQKSKKTTKDKSASL